MSLCATLIKIYDEKFIAISSEAAGKIKSQNYMFLRDGWITKKVVAE